MKLKNSMYFIVAGALVITMATISACSKSSTPAAPPAAPTVTTVLPASDTIGQAITITGTNLTGATVTVGGIAASNVVVASATSITANVPTGAALGTSVVSVTTTGGNTTGSITIVATGPGPVDGYTSSNQVASANLIANWPFDGSSAEAISGKGPVLSGGTATYVPGRIGQAVQLTAGWFTYPSTATWASADNTTLGSNDTLKNGYTVSLWTKHLPDTSTLSTLFQLSSPNIPNWPLLGIQYRKHADSTVDFDGGFSNVDAAGPHLSYADANLFQGSAYKDTGTWAFIAMVYDTATRTLSYYYNGALLGTSHTVASYFVSSSTEPLLLVAPNYASIGIDESNISTPGDTTNPPAGYMATGINAIIDDVRFFNTTLTAQKIKDLYTLGTQGR